MAAIGSFPGSDYPGGRTVKKVKQHISQCEGCAEPLMSLIAAGHDISEYDIDWYACRWHERYYYGSGA